MTDPLEAMSSLDLFLPRLGLKDKKFFIFTLEFNNHHHYLDAFALEDSAIFFDFQRYNDLDS